MIHINQQPINNYDEALFVSCLSGVLVRALWYNTWQRGCGLLYNFPITIISITIHNVVTQLLIDEPHINPQAQIWHPLLTLKMPVYDYVCHAYLGICRDEPAY